MEIFAGAHFDANLSIDLSSEDVPGVAIQLYGITRFQGKAS
ncbi:MAG: hypothetical protein ACTSRA_01040 [Promethearchaeota archaeon]